MSTPPVPIATPPTALIAMKSFTSLIKMCASGGEVKWLTKLCEYNFEGSISASLLWPFPILTEPLVSFYSIFKVIHGEYKNKITLLQGQFRLGVQVKGYPLRQIWRQFKKIQHCPVWKDLCLFVSLCSSLLRMVKCSRYIYGFCP